MSKARQTGTSEYFCQEETKGAPRSRTELRHRENITRDRGDFSLGGHRLSSLYRASDRRAVTLTSRYGAASFWQKYSTGVRGCETPALPGNHRSDL